MIRELTITMEFMVEVGIQLGLVLSIVSEARSSRINEPMRAGD